MSRVSMFAFLALIALAAAPAAKARKSPGNPLPAPNLVSATQLAAGQAECDGNTLTTDDLCVEIVFTKVCPATKYPVEVTKGFDTDGNGCDDAKITDGSTVPAEACTGVNNCLGDTAECQTADVPLGTTSLCVDDGDGIVDCVNDPEDVLVEADSVCTKLKAINPPKPGKNAVSQSTPFSNTVCSDPNDECQ